MVKLTEEQIECVGACGTVQEARAQMLSFVLPQVSGDLARSNIRENINKQPTIAALVYVAWDMLLKGQGFGEPKVVKTKLGIGYARR